MIYLYVKTHNITGLKYLGKTTSRNPYKYLGSGKKWKHHLRKHGKDISTKILLATESFDDFRSTALFFSFLNCGMYLVQKNGLILLLKMEKEMVLEICGLMNMSKN